MVFKVRKFIDESIFIIDVVWRSLERWSWRRGRGFYRKSYGIVWLFRI